MPSVVEINHLDELDQHHLAWSALLAKTPDASFFQSLAWLRAIWRDGAPNRKLKILAVYGRGDLLGFLPLAIFGRRRPLGWRRLLAYANHDHCLPGGPIGPQSAATLWAAFRYLHGRSHAWDQLCLRGNAGPRVKTALQVTGFAVRERCATDAGRIDFRLAAESRRFDEMLFRANERLERWAAPWATAEEIAFERFRPLGAAQGDDSPHWDVFSGCRSPGMTHVAGSAVGAVPIWEVHRTACKAGGADLNVLRVAGEIVAYCGNVHYQGRLDCWCCGVQQRFASSPALDVLTARMLDDSRRRGDSAVCFHGGLAGLFRRWSFAFGRRQSVITARAPRGALLRAWRG